MFATMVSRQFWRAGAGLAILFAGGLFAGGCAAPPQVVAVPPIPAAQARLWFYRQFFPGDTQGMPAIAMNGSATGYALPGTSFYRDVPAGQYHLTVESVGQDVNQSQDVAVAPGQQLYVKIASLPSWEEEPLSGYRRGTYYVMIVAPQLASLELPQTRHTGGN
jgi:hypothetical protein